MRSIDEKWSKQKPWLSVRNISIFIVLIGSIGFLSFLGGNLDITNYIAVNIGIMIAWVFMIMYTMYRDWSYITYIDLSNEDIIDLIRIGERGDNKVFIYKIKKNRIEMVFGIGEGFDYFLKNSKLKVSNRSGSTKRILEEYIDLKMIETHREPVNNRIDPEKLEEVVERWKVKETDRIRDIMLVDWKRGSLAWFSFLIVGGIFLIPFLISFLALFMLIDLELTRIFLYSFLSGIFIGSIIGFILMIFFSYRGDIHTPKYYSFFEEGLIIKLGKDGKVVLIHQDHILKMKVHTLFGWVHVKYSPPSEEYQSEINFILRYEKKDRSKMMKISKKYFRGEYDT